MNGSQVYQWSPGLGPVTAEGEEIRDALGMLDYEGPVEMQVVSHCNSLLGPITELSSIVEGEVDFRRPQLFGDPYPLSGAMTPGSEMRIRFDEVMRPTANNDLSNAAGLMTSERNYDFLVSDAGVQFSGDDHIRIPDGPVLDWNQLTQEQGTDEGAWNASFALYGSSSDALPLRGALFAAGGTGNGLSISFEAVAGVSDSTVMKVEYARTSDDVTVAMAGVAMASLGDSPTWTRLNVVFIPKAPESEGDHPYPYEVHLRKGALSLAKAYLNLSDPLAITNRTLTLGNLPAAHSGETAGSAALTWPMRDFRLWSSQRETFGSPGNAGSPILTGQELGLLCWMRLDELEGVPMDRARNRTVLFEADWWTEEAQYCMSFDGSDSDLLMVTSVNGSPSQTREQTMEFWFKPDALGQEQVMVAIGSANVSDFSGQNVWEIGLNAQNHVVVRNGAVGGGPGIQTLTSSIPVDSSWTHFAMTRALNGSVVLYLDGQQVAASSASSFGVLFAGGQPLKFGGDHGDTVDSSFEGFVGKLDEFRFWDRSVISDLIATRRRAQVLGHPDLWFYLPVDNPDALMLYRKDQSDVASTLPYNNDELVSADVHFIATPITPGTSSSWSISGGGVFVHGVPTEVSSAPGTDAIANFSWNADRDEVVVAFDEGDLWRYEDQLVTFRLPKSLLKDEAGNAMSSAAEFTMWMDMNPLKWAEDEAGLELYFSESEGEFSYSTTIRNVGADYESWEIAGLPGYVEVEPAFGTLAPFDEVEVTFSSATALSMGRYAFDVILKGGLPCGSGDSEFCYGERFSLSVDVLATPPELTLDITQFQEADYLFAEVYHEKVANLNPRDMVMVYAHPNGVGMGGEELRGYATALTCPTHNSVPSASYVKAPTRSSSDAPAMPSELIWTMQERVVCLLRTSIGQGSPSWWTPLPRSAAALKLGPKYPMEGQVNSPSTVSPSTLGDLGACNR